MIMGSQDFPSLWGRYFVVNKLGIILINAWIYVRGGVNSWARVTDEVHEQYIFFYSTPTKDDDSSVFMKTRT